MGVKIVLQFVFLALGVYADLSFMYGRHESCGPYATFLYQADFEMGSVVLDKPGEYCLGEDIRFFPNSEEVLAANGRVSSLETIGRVLADQMVES
jgi:hypothetical protein